MRVRKALGEEFSGQVSGLSFSLHPWMYTQAHTLCLPNLGLSQEPHLLLDLVEANFSRRLGGVTDDVRSITGWFGSLPSTPLPSHVKNWADGEVEVRNGDVNRSKSRLPRLSLPRLLSQSRVPHLLPRGSPLVSGPHPLHSLLQQRREREIERGAMLTSGDLWGAVATGNKFDVGIRSARFCGPIPPRHVTTDSLLSHLVRRFHSCGCGAGKDALGESMV